MKAKCAESFKGEVVNGFNSYREVRKNKDLEIIRRPLMAMDMWFQQSNGGGIIGWWLGAEECSKGLNHILVVNERRAFNSITLL